MARDLLRPYVEIIRALTATLHVERTLDGARIDAVIATALARQSLVSEAERRRHWAQRIENAARFEQYRE
jgi:hypothetical protein